MIGQIIGWIGSEGMNLHVSQWTCRDLFRPPPISMTVSDALRLGLGPQAHSLRSSSVSQFYCMPIAPTSCPPRDPPGSEYPPPSSPSIQVPQLTPASAIR